MGPTQATSWPIPGQADRAQGLELQPKWHLTGQAVAVGEELDEVRQQLAALPDMSEGRAPDLVAVVLAAGVPALAVLAVPALAGGDPRWSAAAVAALALGLGGAAAVWLAQRRATHADGSGRSGVSSVAAGVGMGVVALLMAAAVAWPQAIGLDAATARWLLVAAAAALLSGWSCASAVAEAAEAASGRAKLAQLQANRQWCLQQLADLDGTLQHLWAALPAAHSAGRGCVAQHERAMAQRERGDGGPHQTAPGQVN
jgi:hypothetical protein